MKHQTWNDKEEVECAKCGIRVSVRSAYYDPYNNKMYLTSGSKGCYVHYDCLSQKRKDEILESINKQ